MEGEGEVQEGRNDMVAILRFVHFEGGVQNPESIPAYTE